jgi:KaiC/GvpD/RAD55 family RecA-like ATPase
MRPYRTDRQVLVNLLTTAGAKWPGGPNSNACCCPYHGDSSPSGSIFPGNDKHWRFKCHGCEAKGDSWDIAARNAGQPLPAWLAANADGAGGPQSDQAGPVPPPYPGGAQLPPGMDQPAGSTPPPDQGGRRWPTLQALEDDLAASVGGTLEAEYPYQRIGEEAWAMVVIRIAMPTVGADGKRDKTFRQAHPLPDGKGWVPKAPTGPLPIFRLPEIKACSTVIMVEGEKACDELRAVGIPATTTSGGALNSAKSDLSPLQGKEVVLWPDHDEKGQQHMQLVMTQLLQLPNPPRILVLNPKELPIVVQPKGDAVEYLAAIPGDAEAKRKAVQAVLRAAAGAGSVDDLQRTLEAQIAGTFAVVPFPWPLLTKTTQAFRPGSVSAICGGPGSAKSHMTLSAALHAHQGGYRVAVLELEDSHAFYQQRLLAMLAGEERLLDPKWAKEHPDLVRAALAQHRKTIDDFCPHLTAKENMTMDGVIQWITNACRDGNRIIIVDPITLADPGELKPWEVDRYLLATVKPMIERAGASLILVTHPRKSPGAVAKNAKPSLDDIAGGAMYQRATHTVIYLQNVERTDCAMHTDMWGDQTVSYNKVITVLKARNAAGAGTRLAFNFDATSLRFFELGRIPSPHPRGGSSAAPSPVPPVTPTPPPVPPAPMPDFAAQLAAEALAKGQPTTPPPVPPVPPRASGPATESTQTTS